MKRTQDNVVRWLGYEGTISASDDNEEKLMQGSFIVCDLKMNLLLQNLF